MSVKVGCASNSTMVLALWQTSYELSIVTSEGENDGLSPSSAVISIQLAGDAASEEILFHSPNRESVSPGATLMLYHERRSAEEPFGKLVRTQFATKSHHCLMDA